MISALVQSPLFALDLTVLTCKLHHEADVRVFHRRSRQPTDVPVCSRYCSSAKDKVLPSRSRTHRARSHSHPSTILLCCAANTESGRSDLVLRTHRLFSGVLPVRGEPHGRCSSPRSPPRCRQPHRNAGLTLFHISRRCGTTHAFHHPTRPLSPTS